MLGFIFLLSGCRTKKMVETAYYVHDTVYVYRDSIVYRLIKDSLSEREKTVIQTKHDTVNNTDTVFVTTERERYRIIQKRDTAYLTRYVYQSKDNETENRNIATKKKDYLKFVLFGVIALLCLVIWRLRCNK